MALNPKLRTVHLQTPQVRSVGLATMMKVVQKERKVPRISTQDSSLVVHTVDWPNHISDATSFCSLAFLHQTTTQPTCRRP